MPNGNTHCSSRGLPFNLVFLTGHLELVHLAPIWLLSGVEPTKKRRIIIIKNWNEIATFSDRNWLFALGGNMGFPLVLRGEYWFLVFFSGHYLFCLRIVFGCPHFGLFTFWTVFCRLCQFLFFLLFFLFFLFCFYARLFSTWLDNCFAFYVPPSKLPFSF